MGSHQPWAKVFVGLGILFVAIAVMSYLALHQRLIGLLAIVIALGFFYLSIGPRPNRTLWDKYRWLVGLVFAMLWLGLSTLGRHTDTGEITAVTRVEERYSDHHDAVTFKSGKATFHFEDSVNMFVGKSHYLHLQVSDKQVKVTTSGVLPSNFFMPQNILSVK